MKKFKNKKTFLICLLGFYVLVAIFTGVTMYLPYMDTEEYYDEEEEDYVDEEDYSEEGEDYSEEEEDYVDEEDYSEEEEDYSEEEEDYSEDEEDYVDEEDYSEEEDDSADFDDTQESEDESYDEEAENSPNTAPNTTPLTSVSTEVQAVPDQTVPDSSPLSFSYTGKSRLNIRREPSMSAGIVGTISQNSTGMILEFTDNKWAKVTCNNLEGYVAYEYIEYTLPEGTLIPSPKPSAAP